MTTTRVLFIGGTGVISSACVRQALSQGMEVTVLNRGVETLRPAPPEVRVLRADATNPQQVRAAVAGQEWDAVVQCVAFTPQHVAQDIETFTDSTGQYVVISSASAYAKPVPALPITEATPLRNPFWEYSRGKIAIEDTLTSAYREHGFPMTIVRPSHTYDATRTPLLGDWAAVERMRRGEPVVVHGDGTSLWVLTHASDVAAAMVGLLANPAAIGRAFHITSDEVMTWDGVYRAFGHAVGVEPVLRHVASETIAAALPELGPTLLGDKAHSVIFDNTAIKRAVPGWYARVPYRDGVREAVEFHLAHPEHGRDDTEMRQLLQLL